MQSLYTTNTPFNTSQENEQVSNRSAYLAKWNATSLKMLKLSHEHLQEIVEKNLAPQEAHALAHKFVLELQIIKNEQLKQILDLMQEVQKIANENLSPTHLNQTNQSDRFHIQELMEDISQFLSQVYKNPS